jgi:hypothetical protein
MVTTSDVFFFVLILYEFIAAHSWPHADLAGPMFVMERCLKSSNQDSERHGNEMEQAINRRKWM